MRGFLVCLCAFTLAGGCTGTVGSDSEPRPGGAAPPPSEPQKPAEVGAEFRCDATDSNEPGAILVRRLTNPEFVAALESTLGVDVQAEAAALLPPDVRADGFSNTSAALVVSLTHVQAYESLAQTAVDRIVDFDAFVGRYVDCRDLTSACQDRFIDEIGLRIYRGPVEADERTALRTVFASVETEGGAFDEAARLTLQAMLQSPRFLYRVERQGGPISDTSKAIDPYELASRMAFLVWQAPPDEALLMAASGGTLGTDAGIESEIRRLLQDDRARVAARRYVVDWLNLDRLEALPRSTDHFPEWDPALGADMRAETLAVFDWLVWEELRPLADLFAVQRTFVSRRLAEHYGLPNPQDGSIWYELEDVAERGGLLTQGAVSTIGGDEASMVTRGLFLLKSVLCGDLADPPPGVDTTPTEPEAGRSQRFYSEERIANPSCGGCHSQMEPLAFGIERFDATGAYATTDRFGNDLGQDGSVIFPGQTTGPAPFGDIGELMTLLAGSDRVRDCMSLKVSQWAMGRPIANTDGCSMAAIRDRFVTGGGTYHELMVGIALSPMFRRIRIESQLTP